MAQRYTGRSPRRDSNYQYDDPSSKIKEILKNDLAMLKEENLILKNKCTKIGDLEEKVQTLVRQNSALHSQNQKLTQLANQRRSELQIVKNRMQSHAQQKYGQSVSHEFQVKKLLAQIDHLNSQIREIEQLKSVQISQLKSQFQLQLQSSKKTQSASQDVYQSQIRKLRQQLQRRDFQMNQYLNKMRKVSSQSQYQIHRLREQKQKLRTQLNHLEVDRRNEQQNLREKMQSYYSQEIETLRRNNSKALQALQIDNSRLKDSLDIKNMEIQQLSSKIYKQKTHYEDTIAILARQNDSIRGKLLEMQRINDEEFQILKEKLLQVQQSQIHQIKVNHQMFVVSLKNQISKLEAHLKNKTDEVQQIIKEKSMARNNFESDINRYKDEINQNKSAISELQKTMAKIIDSHQQKIREKDKQIGYLESLNADQQASNEKQISSLRQLLSHQKVQAQSIKMNFREKQQHYIESLNNYKNQSLNLKDQVRHEKSQRQRIQQELKLELSGTSNQMRNKIDGVTIKCSALERDNDSLRSALASKKRQNNILSEQLQNSSNRQKILERQLDDIRDKTIKKDKRMNQLITQQKQRLEASFQNAIENMRNDSDKNLKAEHNRYRDLQQKFQKKQKQLQNLLRTYKTMINQVEVLKDQQANKKELTLKYPGATSDLIANKNLFDVYIKTKVLDLCGDAMKQPFGGKQN